MRSKFAKASPELYLAGGVIVSLVAAGIFSRVPAIAFGGFTRMAAVLVATDVVLYVLMKLGLMKAPRDRAS